MKSENSLETNVLRARIIRHNSDEEALAEIVPSDVQKKSGFVRLHLSRSTASTEMRRIGDGQYRFSFAPGLPMFSLPAIGKMVMIDQAGTLWAIDRTPSSKSKNDTAQEDKPVTHHNGVPIFHRPSTGHTTHNGVVCRT